MDYPVIINKTHFTTYSCPLPPMSEGDSVLHSFLLAVDNNDLIAIETHDRAFTSLQGGELHKKLITLPNNNKG